MNKSLFKKSGEVLARFMAVVAGVFAIGTGAVWAHVGYVLEHNEFEKSQGLDWGFVLEPFKNGNYVLMILGVIAAFVLLNIFVPRLKIFKALVRRMNLKGEEYEDLFPWIMRLSLGIALIGSGSLGVLISPVLGGMGHFAFVQTVLGFLLLAGFLTVPAAIGAVILYFVGLSQNLYLLGNLDFLALAVSTVIMADGRPGVDDMLGMPKFGFLRKFEKYVPVILRVGIGLAMIYLGLFEKIFNPHAAELVVKNFGLQNVFPVSTQMWVMSTGVIEFFIGVFLVIGFRVRLFSVIAFLVISSTFFYFNEAVFSHVTLFGLLSILVSKKPRKS